MPSRAVTRHSVPCHHRSSAIRLGFAWLRSDSEHAGQACGLGRSDAAAVVLGPYLILSLSRMAPHGKCVRVRLPVVSCGAPRVPKHFIFRPCERAERRRGITPSAYAPRARRMSFWCGVIWSRGEAGITSDPADSYARWIWPVIAAWASPPHRYRSGTYYSTKQTARQQSVTLRAAFRIDRHHDASSPPSRATQRFRPILVEGS